MPITLNDMRKKVLGHLQKEENYQGFFTDAKLNNAINESIDFAESIMFFDGQGWSKEIINISNTAGQSRVPLPDNIAVIDKILFKSSDNIYYPLVYDDERESSENFDGTGQSQPWSVSLMGQALNFVPPLETSGVDNIKLYYRYFHTDLTNNTDILNSQFNKALVNYICFRAAGQLADVVGLGPSYFTTRENEWYAAMTRMVNQRNRTVMRTREFDDC